jgi:hypothetical protein
MLSAEERAAYRDKLKARIRQWEARLDMLRAKKDEAAADARLRLDREVKEAVKQREEARKELAAMREGGATAWEESRGQLQCLAARMRDTLRDAADQIRKYV